MKKTTGIFLFIIYLFTSTITKAQESDGVYFTGQYLFSNSAITLEKSNSLMAWNVYGPQYSRGITDNFQVGVTSFWLLSPILFEAKYAYSITDKVHVGITGTMGVEWLENTSEPSSSINGTITLGDKNANISGSIYGFNLDTDSGNLYNISAYYKLNRKRAIIFESFLVNTDGNGLGGALVPGVQFLTKRNRMLNLGFATIFYEDVFLPIPLPFLQLQVPFN